jgi:hypothetical protein
MGVECVIEFVLVFEIASGQMKAAEQCRPPLTMNDRIAFELLPNAMNCNDFCHVLPPIRPRMPPFGLSHYASASQEQYGQCGTGKTIQRKGVGSDAIGLIDG